MNQSTATESFNRPLLYIRSLVFWIFSIINTLIMAIPVLGFSPFSYRLAAAAAKIWARGNLWGLRFFATWIVR